MGQRGVPGPLPGRIQGNKRPNDLPGKQQNPISGSKKERPSGVNCCKEDTSKTFKVFYNPRCQPPGKTSKARGGQKMETPKGRLVLGWAGVGFPWSLASQPASDNSLQCLFHSIGKQGDVEGASPGSPGNSDDPEAQTGAGCQLFLPHPGPHHRQPRTAGRFNRRDSTSLIKARVVLNSANRACTADKEPGPAYFRVPEKKEQYSQVNKRDPRATLSWTGYEDE